MPDEPENVKMAKSTRSVAFSICFMISSSGVCSGAKSTFTGTPLMLNAFGTSPWTLRPNCPLRIMSNSTAYSRHTRQSWKTTTWLRLRWVSVTVKLVEPDSRAEVGFASPR